MRRAVLGLFVVTLLPACGAAQAAARGAAEGAAGAVVGGGAYAGGGGATAGSSGPISGPQGGEDAHYVRDNEYLVIANDADASNEWAYFHLSTVVTAASPATKNEGEFMKLGDSTKAWRARFFLTRPASAADFRPGVDVLVYEGAQDEYGAYGPPSDRDHARSGAWFNCKIGDMSDSHKGYILCGSWKVQTKNVRVLR